MQEKKDKLTPEQLILRTIILSVFVHVLFLSFNWYQKSDNQKRDSKLRVTLQPFKETEISKPEQLVSPQSIAPEEPASSDLVITEPEIVQVPVEERPPEVTNEPGNYGQIQSSLTSILTTDNPQANSAEICSNGNLCPTSHPLELDEDRFGFRAAMSRPDNIGEQQLDTVFDESEANSNLFSALSVSDSVDQAMADSTQLYVSDMREQRKLQDCAGEKEGAACKGQVNIVTLLRLSSKVLEKITED